VSEQVANRDLAGEDGRIAADDEAGKELSQGCIEVEQASLMHQHGCGCGEDDLGEASHVEHGGRGDFGGAGFVGEVSQRIVEQGLTVRKKAECTSGEGFGGDGFPQNGVCFREA